MTWDAAVIGAGPAGSLTARELARRGLKVILLDKATFPRKKVCGGCLNRHALDALTAFGLGALPTKLGAAPLTRAKLAAGGRAADVAIPVGAGLARDSLDLALIVEAISAGVTFRPATPAAMGAAIGYTRAVRAGADDIRVGVVILADGLNSRAEPRRGSRIGAGVLFDAAPDFYEPGIIHMAAGRGGYVGLVRVDGGRLDAAAALDAKFVTDRGGIAPAVATLLATAGWPALPAAAWKGTPPLTRRPKTIAGERWFAVGDAAGYVEPFTGEGMAWAMAGAAALAPLAAQPWRATLADEWPRAYYRAVGRRQRVARAAAFTLRRPAVCSLVIRLLAARPGLARPVVRALNAPPRQPPVPA